MRALLRHPRVEPLVSRALLARYLRRPWSFFRAEGRADDGIHSYALRGGRGAFMAVRHGTYDVNIFDEIFYQRLYEPPVEVEALLDRPGDRVRVLDLGGNVGMFGTWLAQRTAFAELTSYEPDAANADVLQRAIDVNVQAGIVSPGGWVLVRAAAGDHDGVVRFATGGFATSHVVEDAAPGATVEVQLRDVLARELMHVDVLKMDVEGGEWPILDDERFAASPDLCVVVLEYHPEMCPVDDPHEHARRRLEERGFTYRRIPMPHAPEGVGMAWAWR